MKRFSFESLDAKELGEVDLERVRELLAQNERSMESLGTAQDVLISNIERLKRDVPHDDVREDDRTLSYHVLKNSWCGDLMKLAEIEGELKNDQAVLQDILGETVN